MRNDTAAATAAAERSGAEPRGAERERWTGVAGSATYMCSKSTQSFTAGQPSAVEPSPVYVVYLSEDASWVGIATELEEATTLEGPCDSPELPVFASNTAVLKVVSEELTVIEAKDVGRGFCEVSLSAVESVTGSFWPLVLVGVGRMVWPAKFTNSFEFPRRVELTRRVPLARRVEFARRVALIKRVELTSTPASVNLEPVGARCTPVLRRTAAVAASVSKARRRG